MTFDGDERRRTGYGGGRVRRTGGVVVRERRRRGGLGGLRTLTVAPRNKTLIWLQIILFDKLCIWMCCVSF